MFFLILSLLSPERASNVNSVPLVNSGAPHHTLGWTARDRPRREAGLPFPETLRMCAVDECSGLLCPMWPPQSSSWLRLKTQGILPLDEGREIVLSGIHTKIVLPHILGRFFVLGKTVEKGANRKWLTF